MRFEFRHLLIACAIFIAFCGGAAWANSQGLVGAWPVNPPVVLSGADIGFRVTGHKDDIAVGRLVVRVNGNWKEVEFSYQLKQLTK